MLTISKGNVSERRLPFVTVHMITYNHAPYIRRAVEGVLSQQTDFPFELVIGEDCSTDGTREIVHEYAREYPAVIRLVASDENVGARPNSERVYAASRGKYVAYCEGDDYWHHPGKLAMQVGFLEAHPEYGLVHTNYDVSDVTTGRHQSAVIGDPGDLRGDEAYLDILRRRRRILTLTVCARSCLVKQVLENEPECKDGRWPMGDTQLWFELARLGPMKFFLDSTATYQVLPESASNSRNPARKLNFVLKAGRLILHYLDKYPVDAGLDRLVRRRTYTELMAAAFAAGDRTTANLLMRELKMTGCGVSFEAAFHWLLAGRRAARPMASTLNLAFRLKHKIHG